MRAKEPNPSPNRWNKVKVKPPASPAPPRKNNEENLLERIEDLEYRLRRLEDKVDNHIYIDPYGF